MTGIPSENLKNQRCSTRRGVQCAAKSDGGGSRYIIHQDQTRIVSMTIKAARLKDQHAVHPREHQTPLTMLVRALEIVLLFSLVATLSGLPTTAVPGKKRFHKSGIYIILQSYLRKLFSYNGVLYFPKKKNRT